MAFGQFTLVIDGHQQDGTIEKKAKLYLVAQGSGIILSDTEFRFPTKYAKPGGEGISVPGYEIPLDTDKAAGEGDSTTVGYEGFITSGEHGPQQPFQFAAPEAGTMLNLREVTSAVALPVADLQQFRDETVAARDEAVALLDPVTAITYNTDGTVASVTEAGITTTYTYNTDGTVATHTRLGVTRTYTYSGGNLTGVA